MQREPARKYQIWSNSAKQGALARTSSSPLIEPHRVGRPQRSLVLSAAQRADLDDLRTSILMYGYGLPLELTLEGMCTLPNGGPTKCKTHRISSESVDIKLELNPLTSWFMPRQTLPKGSNVHLALNEVGAFSGEVTSQDKIGFRVSVDKAQRQKLGAKLVDVAARRGMGFTAPIGAGTVSRIEPYDKSCNYVDHTNTFRRGTIVSVSQKDALIRATLIPPIKALIAFRGPRRLMGEVTDTYEIGFMARFVGKIPNEEFSASLKLSDL